MTSIYNFSLLGFNMSFSTMAFLVIFFGSVAFEFIRPQITAKMIGWAIKSGTKAGIAKTTAAGLACFAASIALLVVWPVESIAASVLIIPVMLLLAKRTHAKLLKELSAA